MIREEHDYVQVEAEMLEGGLFERAGEILFSPTSERQNLNHWAQWNLDHQLVVRMQLQLHNNFCSWCCWVDEQVRVKSAGGKLDD